MLMNHYVSETHLVFKKYSVSNSTLTFDTYLNTYNKLLKGLNNILLYNKNKTVLISGAAYVFLVPHSSRLADRRPYLLFPTWILYVLDLHFFREANLTLFL